MSEQSIKDLAYRTAAGVLGGPVDIATMFMRPFGFKTPDTDVFGGSEYLGKKMEDVGLISSARSPITEFITSLAVPTPGGVAKGAAIAAPALAGIFVGKGSKTWDVIAATKAKELEAAKVDPKIIWQQTGTWKGPDGKWRQEIDDSAANLQDMAGLLASKRYVADKERQQILDSVKASGNKPTAEQIDRVNYLNRQLSSTSYGGTVGNVLDYPDLYKAIPEAQTTKINRIEMPVGERGSLSNTGINLSTGPEPLAQKSTLLHELQHLVQNREGFARGGNPDEMVLVLEKIARQKRLEAQDMFNLSSARDPLDPTKIVKPGARTKGLELEKQAREIDDLAMMAYRSEQAKFDLYRRLGGEAEARAVQTRRDFTPEQRRATFPEESYDIPINQVINR